MLSIIRQRFIKHLRQITVNFTPSNEKSQDHYYFGYGANLSIDRFQKRNMNVSEVSNAVLRNYELKFTLSNEYLNKGYAGIHPKKDCEVWGVLYKIDKNSLKLLDALEWCGFGAYERVQLTVERSDLKQKVQAWGYIVKRPKYDLVPSKIYLNNMIATSKERGFPCSYVEFIESHQYQEVFEIDHGFSLLFYGKRRLLEKKLRPLYMLHDKLREKLCELI